MFPPPGAWAAIDQLRPGPLLKVAAAAGVGLSVAAAIAAAIRMGITRRTLGRKVRMQLHRTAFMVLENACYDMRLMCRGRHQPSAPHNSSKKWSLE